jgi:hypothetical protein
MVKFTMSAPASPLDAPLPGGLRGAAELAHTRLEGARGLVAHLVAADAPHAS